MADMTRHVRVLGPESYAWRLLGMLQAAGADIDAAYAGRCPDEHAGTVHALVTVDTAARLEQHAADCRARLAALEADR